MKNIIAVFLTVIVSFQAGILNYGNNKVIDNQEINYYAEKSVTADPTFYSLQEGAFTDVLVSGEDTSVLYAVTSYAWEDELRQRMINAINTYERFIEIEDLNIAWTQENYDAITKIYFDMLNSNPNYFFASTFRLWGFQDGSYTKMDIIYKENYSLEDQTPDIDKIKQDRALYEGRIETALSYVKPNMTDVEAALAVHDFLVRECDYDYGNYLNETIPPESGSSYGVLVKNQAVCQGYALAYLDLMKRLGMSCMVVSSPEMNHAWNLLYLDGNWYHVDATWDDPIFEENQDYVMEGKVYHTYFLCSDSEFVEQKGHYGWSKDAPAANNSNSYEGYCFREKASAMNYFNGMWYYLSDNGQVIRSTIEGNEVSEPLCEGRFDYIHGIGADMYLANADGVYKISTPDFSNIKNIRIWKNESEYQNYTQTEFTIKNEKLIAVLQDNSTKQDIRLEMEPEKKLVDVEETSWQYGPAKYVYEKGIMTGKGYDKNGNILFAPNEMLTREQFAQVLYSAEGKPDITYSVKFSDVQDKKWYTEAVLWAAEQGIVSGYGNGKFGVSQNITREQLAAMLYKYAEYKNYDQTVDASLNQFSDVEDISSWAVTQLQWAVTHGVMSGKGTKLDPKGDATRAECAAMLRTFFTKFES